MASAHIIIAPQSFSGGGLVFKVKLVTMERVWWVTIDKYMIGYCGIWVLRACDVFVRGLLPFLAVAGYYRKWRCINKLIGIYWYRLVNIGILVHFGIHWYIGKYWCILVSFLYTGISIFWYIGTSIFWYFVILVNWYIGI